MPLSDTIYAPATARGRAGVGIVRISGAAACEVCSQLTTGAVEAHRTHLRTIRDGSGNVIDRGLVIHFPEGASFTGEDVVELHLHGGTAVMDAALDAISATGLARLAQPGEFTRRAMANGLLDLTQVRGLADLIDAETEMQRRQAMTVMDGAFSNKITAWRAALIEALAYLEVTIDFADEEVPEDVTGPVGEILGRLISEIDEQVAGSRAAQRLRDGYRVALVGAPNVGKSSLLNALTKTDAAIVSDIAGTTRDIVQVRMSLGGIPVTIQDTAGIRETSDPVEREGVNRARAHAEDADLTILLCDGRSDEAEIEFDIRVRTKADIDPMGDISATTGVGLEPLLAKISESLGAEVERATVVTAEDDRIRLEAAVRTLRLVVENLSERPTELIAQDLRDVLYDLQVLLGAVDIEDVLGKVFSSFCLGK